MTLDNLEIEREDIGKKVYRITEYYIVEKTFRVLAKDEDEAADKLYENVKIDWDKVEIEGVDSDVQYYSGDHNFDKKESYCEGEVLEEDFDKDDPNYYDNEQMKKGDQPYRGPYWYYK